MNSFGKWSGEERKRSLRLCQAAERAGLIRKPTKCVYCGQTEGPIQYHTLDYDVEMEVAQKMLLRTATEEDIERFYNARVAVCRRCHMHIHSPFKLAAQKYFDEVSKGRKFPPMFYK